MKCEMCNYQQTPDNLQSLVNQAETCETQICKTAKIVWRDGQMTLTTSPTSDEHEFNTPIRDLPSPEIPVGGPMAFVFKASGFGSTTTRVDKDDKNND
jgi:hypothetical protein